MYHDVNVLPAIQYEYQMKFFAFVKTLSSLKQLFWLEKVNEIFITLLRA